MLQPMMSGCRSAPSACVIGGAGQQRSESGSIQTAVWSWTLRKQALTYRQNRGKNLCFSGLQTGAPVLTAICSKRLRFVMWFLRRYIASPRGVGFVGVQPTGRGFSANSSVCQILSLLLIFNPFDVKSHFLMIRVALLNMHLRNTN